ncbi:MAG: 1-(5-phosphoribosyl)-5-[(5-phosphoribosylamino)methylideneamino]imidazole-4-carboxamide isomerase [Acidimicrobiales bacterium]
MELLAAIDLVAGGAVRLEQGDFGRMAGYGDPLALAARFVAGGARWLHVVDLDAARSGEPANRPLVRSIIALAAEAGVRVQTGGGVRRPEDADELLAAGAARVVLGTAVLEDPAVVGRCAEANPGRVAVGLDYRRLVDGTVELAGRGWLERGGRPLEAVLDSLAGSKVAAVVATAIDRDGTLGGPDVAGLAALLDRTELPVVASGGVAGAGDLRALASLAGRRSGRRLEGVVVGKALVDGRLAVDEALVACEPSG